MRISDFNIQVGAKLENGASAKLQQELKNIKGLSLEIESATLSKDVASNIKSQLESAVKGINIDLGKAINFSGSGQAQQVGQNIGKQISNGIASQLSNTNILSDFKKSLSNIGMSSGDIDKVANRIENLHVKIESLGQSLSSVSGKNGKKNILSVEIKGIDEYGQAIKLTQAWNTDTMKLIKNIDSVSTATKNMGQSVSQVTEKTKDIQSAYSKLQSMIKEFSSKQQKLELLDPDANKNQIEELKSQIKTLETEIAKTLNEAYTSAKDDPFLSQTELFQKLIGLAEQYSNILSKIGNNTALQSAKQLDSLVQKAQNIKTKFDIGDFDVQVSQIESAFKKWGISGSELEATMRNIRTALKSVSDEAFIFEKTGDPNGLIQAQKKYQQEIDTTKNKLKEMATIDITPAQKISLSNKIEKWLLNNTAATKEAREEMQLYLKELQSTSSIEPARFSEINNKVTEIDNLMRAQGKLGKSWSDTFKSSISSFAQWTAATVSFMDVINAIRQAVSNVYEIDTAMTNLYKVTEETDARYNKFLTSASENAVKLGRNVSSLVEQTANWAKLGYSIDESEQLAQISSVYANVGEVNDDTAVSDMVTAMKAFNIQSSNAVTIIDQLNALGNQFATSSADLGEGLSKSASSMATAGSDLNHTLAMLTGGAEITQSAGEFGNFLKVAGMRIRGMTGDLEALGEEVDESVDSISKVQTQILNRTHGKVNIFDENGNFRDYYDIMQDIANVYDRLSSTDQASLSEILFGKMRGNQGAALIQAFQSGQVQKAYEATLNAAGSAQEEQDRWMGSMEAKLGQLEAATQTLSNDLLNSDILKFFIDLGTIGVQSIDSLVNALTPLGTVFTAISGVLGAKGSGLTNYVTIHKFTSPFL